MKLQYLQDRMFNEITGRKERRAREVARLLPCWELRLANRKKVKTFDSGFQCLDYLGKKYACQEALSFTIQQVSLRGKVRPIIAMENATRADFTKKFNSRSEAHSWVDGGLIYHRLAIYKGSLDKSLPHTRYLQSGSTAYTYCSLTPPLFLDDKPYQFVQKVLKEWKEMRHFYLITLQTFPWAEFTEMDKLHVAISQQFKKDIESKMRRRQYLDIHYQPGDVFRYSLRKENE